jgi:hypothetical protein
MRKHIFLLHILEQTWMSSGQIEVVLEHFLWIILSNQ